MSLTNIISTIALGETIGAGKVPLPQTCLYSGSLPQTHPVEINKTYFLIQKEPFFQTNGFFAIMKSTSNLLFVTFLQ